MNELKVPYGFNEEGVLVSSESAIRGASYFCPACGDRLIHRAGEINAKHFSHPSGTNCSPEAIIHKIAKHLIAKAINQNSKGLATIKIENYCECCGLVFDIEIPNGTFTHAEQEVSFHPYVCDIAAYRENAEPLGIEIFNTHKVEKEKRGNLSIYWLELKAEKVIQNPFYWQPTQSKLKSINCSACNSYCKHVVSVASKWNISRELYSPIKRKDKAPYVAATEVCFKCEEEIPVFWWHGVPFCQTNPPEPKPKTIQFRNSKQWNGKYWANTCPNCNVIQGDNHLFISEGSPFSGLPLNYQNSQRLKIVSGSEAVSEFYKVVNRIIPKL